MYVASNEIEKKFFSEGEIVFEEGDTGDAAFIIETGLVQIFKVVEGEKVHLAFIKEGELFGEMAVIDGSPRMANAQALEGSVLVCLPRKLFDSKLQKYDPVMRSMIQMLLDNLRNVHKAYMLRPRNVTDYLNAMAYHSDSFQMYLEKLQDPELMASGLKELHGIDMAIARLREQFKDHVDHRDSALTLQQAAKLLNRNPIKRDTH